MRLKTRESKAKFTDLLLALATLTVTRRLNQETLAVLTNDEQGLPLGNGLDGVLDSCFGYKKVGARNYSEPDTNLLVI